MVDEPRYRARFRREDGEPDDWSDGRPETRSTRRPEPRLEQRLDEWMTAGRQLVDGVAGARPGSRPSARGAAAGGVPRLRPGDLGRWVEQKIDWLLEDDDGWREPWQAASPTAGPPSRRRPLEAISRRSVSLLPERQGPAPDSQDWPADDNFTVNRWRRPSAPPVTPADQSRPSGRAVPRSSRRRWD